MNLSPCPPLSPACPPLSNVSRGIFSGENCFLKDAISKKLYEKEKLWKRKKQLMNPLTIIF